MILQNITIVNLGTIEHFSYDFADGLNWIKTRNLDEIVTAVRVVLNHKDIPPLPPYAVREETQIEATVFIDKKQYKIIAQPNGMRRGLVLQAYDDLDFDVTSEYLYLTDHCAEQDFSDFFEGNQKDIMPLRFLQYAAEDLYFPQQELSVRTEKMSNLKAFHAYLRRFINHFQPELIREGKQYEIVLGKDGRYAVKHKSDYGMSVYLSESEQILFRYLCFLRTAEFWRGFEEIRNIHGIKKPLIIKGFLERLDESIDIRDIMDRTEDLKRQVIVLV